MRSRAGCGVSGWRSASCCKSHTGFVARALDAQTAAPVDAKTELQEWAMKRKHVMPAYEIVSQTGPAHAPTFHVSVTVLGVTAQGEGLRGGWPNKPLLQNAFTL